MAYDRRSRQQAAEARRIEQEAARATRLALKLLAEQEAAEANATGTKVGKKITRRNRQRLIPADRVCRFCGEVRVQSKAWVVRVDVVLCRSCYNLAKEYTGKPFPSVGEVNWSVDPCKRYPVEGCKCRYCVLERQRVG